MEQSTATDASLIRDAYHASEAQDRIADAARCVQGGPELHVVAGMWLAQAHASVEHIGCAATKRSLRDAIASVHDMARAQIKAVRP